MVKHCDVEDSVSSFYLEDRFHAEVVLEALLREMHELLDHLVAVAGETFKRHHFDVALTLVPLKGLKTF